MKHPGQICGRCILECAAYTALPDILYEQLNTNCSQCWSLWTGSSFYHIIPSLDFCALVLMHTSRKERRNWKGSGRNYVDDERLEKRWSLEPNVFWVSEIVGAGVCDLAGARDQLFPGNSIKKWFHMYEMQTQDRSQGDSNRESKTVFIQWRSLITGTEQQRSGRFSVLLFAD